MLQMLRREVGERTSWSQRVRIGPFGKRTSLFAISTPAAVTASATSR